MCHPVDPEVVYNDHAEQQLEMPGSGRTIPTFAYDYHPEEHKPAIIIIHDVFGASPFYRDMARRLAQAGFTAILPELFCREGALPDATMQAAIARARRFSFGTAVEDVRTIANTLQAQGRKIGIVGFCMGGSLSLFAATMPEIRASVVYYGQVGNKRKLHDREISPLEDVEHVQAPILGFFGAQDAGISVESVHAYEDAARRAGKTIDFTIYPGLGHAFMTFDIDKASTQASQESWARTLEFFHEQLDI